MDWNSPHSDYATARLSILDISLQLGLAALLIYFCGRILAPFTGILMWSTILAVMLYPLHKRLRTYIGNRWSALLIGFVGVAVLLVPTVLAVTSLGSSVYGFLSEHHNLSLPPPPQWLTNLPYFGPKLAETWVLVANNVPAALAKFGQSLSAPAAWLASFAGGLAAGELSFMLSFAFAAVIVAYGDGGAQFAHRLLEVVTGSPTRAAKLVTLTAATIRGVAQGVVGVAVI